MSGGRCQVREFILGAHETADRRWAPITSVCDRSIRGYLEGLRLPNAAARPMPSANASAPRFAKQALKHEHDVARECSFAHR